MNVHVLACDYDGTIADGGQCSADIARVLGRVRESGRKVLLVTGRMLPDLRRVCAETDHLFDVVVAENGALLYFPDSREAKTLGDAPETALVEELRRRGVPFDLGSSIIATTDGYAEAALAAIRETGVERTLVFNKGSLMLLPGGVTKGTGLDAALTGLALSPHNMVGIGDAENDHAFLAMSECAVAVADAIPALRERADYVTRAPGSRGVMEFLEEHLVNDLVALVPRLTRHRLPLSESHDGEPVTISPHSTRLLIVGPSASGKSTLTGLLLERLVESGRSVLLVDPEGDYQAFSELERVVVLGGSSERVLPTPDELRQLLHQPRTSLVLNLSAMTRAEKVAYAAKALGAVAVVRSTTGLPHWLILDEAHHIAPADGSPVAELLRGSTESLCLSTLDVNDLAPELRTLPNVVAATELEAFAAAVRAAAGGRTPSLAGAPLAQGEVAIAWLGPEARVQRFRVAKRRVQHRRHVRKYTEGELPPERSFYFRGPAAALNLRAANLVRFVELAEGVDEATWDWHLKQQDYSAWARAQIKDEDLAGALAAVETAGLPPAESRRRALDEIRVRYTV